MIYTRDLDSRPIYELWVDHQSGGEYELIYPSWACPLEVTRQGNRSRRLDRCVYSALYSGPMLSGGRWSD